MKEALLYGKVNGNGDLQCFSCLGECLIPAEKTGFFRTR